MCRRIGECVSLELFYFVNQQLFTHSYVYILNMFVYMNSLSVFFFASLFYNYLSSYTRRRHFSVKGACGSLILVFCRIGEYISLDLFYFFQPHQQLFSHSIFGDLFGSGLRASRLRGDGTAFCLKTKNGLLFACI